ncbi:hypothetical protein V511_12430 [Mesotoga sp. Brook.08.YT.4.2.5.1]|uniref:hypothetical protein n=1 Tax=unclassified Mesotoga TaxID=1184398 RepID=UPI000C19120B|nr:MULTISPECIES: hypothetical protein [unclassified Mesotoga]PNE19819.1 hypothetical protein V511_12430 [Mesotoga sp. Brook.08.YT.4.2.5.1]PVD16000.1 hypothetical protein V512_003485 [Mesotoga sp. Brook.08.105.5.1]RAM59105.1 hypothetical protein DS65_00065 [Mesotoga sp. SC_4PWL113PWK15]RDI94323.1 hypothetical protein Q502_00770 [Mesotoga sp. Brook.08.YT.4.2.5.2.]
MKTFRSFVFVLLMAILLSGCYIKLYEENGLETRLDGNDMVFILKSEADAIELLIDETIDFSKLLVPDDYLKIVKYIDESTLIALARGSTMNQGEEVLRIEGLTEKKLITSIKIWNTQDIYHESNGTEPELLGDFTGDGQVEGFDFIPFAQSYGNALGSPGYDAIYDMSSLGNLASKTFSGIWEKIYSQEGVPDGKIDGPDFIVFANNYGFANPYLGTWTFTGAIDYESSSFGQVDATGEGTATIQSSNFNFVGSVTMSFEADYEDESGNPLHSEMTTTINNVSFNFDNLVMTIDATVEDPTGSGSTYDVQLRGSLRTDGNAVYAEVPSGDIYLLNPERKIGTWSGSKQ